MGEGERKEWVKDTREEWVRFEGVRKGRQEDGRRCGGREAEGEERQAY